MTCADSQTAAYIAGGVTTLAPILVYRLLSLHNPHCPMCKERHMQAKRYNASLGCLELTCTGCGWTRRAP